jgi:hypothetical protein
MLGAIENANIDWNDTFYRKEPYLAGFFQDDWKLNNRLTLNLGLRYDVQWPMVELHDRVVAGFDFDSKSPVSDAALAVWRRNASTIANYPTPPAQLNGGSLLYAGKNGQPRSPYNFDLSNIQPRIGLAYRIHDKSVLRAGVGIFHRTVTQGSLTTGFSQTTGYVRSRDAGITPAGINNGLPTGAFSIENPFPNGLIPPLQSNVPAINLVGTGFSFDPRQRLVPRTYQFSFGLDTQLFWGITLDASYIGSATVKEPMAINLNAQNEEFYEAARANPVFYQTPLPNPFLGIAPNTVNLGVAPTIGRATFFLPRPQLGGVTNNILPWGRVWYNGLQVKFEKRMLPGSKVGTVTWVLNYTWSKQMERFMRENFAYAFQRWNNWGHQLTDIDVRQQLTLAGVYDLPVGKGRPWLNAMPKAAEMILGGWNYNYWLDWNSGVPTGLNTGWDFTCGSYQVANQTELSWFENGRTGTRPNCYVQRGPYTFRQLPARHGRITDPTAVQVNMAIAKKIAINERWSAEIRGEAFNAFNTPIRQGPNTDPNSAQFGILPVAQFNFPRNIQIGARIRF